MTFPWYGRFADACLVLFALLLVGAATAATVQSPKLVFAAIGLAGLIGLLLLPKRYVAPISISVIVALAFAVGAPGAPSTGWLVTSGVAVLLTAVSLVRTESIGTGRWSVVAVLAAFYLALALATVLGIPENLGQWMLAALVPICTAVLTSTVSARGLRLVALALVILSIGESMIALAEITVLHEPIWGSTAGTSGDAVIRVNTLFGNGLRRAQGTVGHPVVLGFVLAIGFVIAWTNVARIRGVFRWPALGVIAGGLLLSGTRSALAAAALGVLLVLFTGRDVSRKMRAVFVVVFLGAIALVLKASIEEAASEVQTTGSYTHRLGALGSVGGLLGRPLREALLGSGVGSEKSLFLRGLLQTDGFFAVDNELVSVLAIAGLLGAALLLLLCVVATRHSAPRMRGLLAATFVMFFSFDLTSWNLGSTMLALVMALAVRQRSLDLAADGVLRGEGAFAHRARTPERSAEDFLRASSRDFRVTALNEFSSDGR